MGLDMYLEGRKYNAGRIQPMEDGFKIKEVVLELGYWRKHPNLHGYIVQEFADGEDNCQDIMLDRDCLTKLRAAIVDNILPDTTGFFFGKSPKADSMNADEKAWFEEQKAEDLKTIDAAIAWLGPEPYKGDVWRSVIYRASW